MVKKQHVIPHLLCDLPQPCEEQSKQDAEPCLDVHAIWRASIGLDLEDRSVLEAEVLLWRICSVKSAPSRKC